jgi:hypothetical protein
MEMTLFLRFIMLFMTFSTTLALNLGDNLVSRLGLTANVGFILLVASILTYRASGRRSFIVVTVVLLSLVANMSADFTLNMGVDRDYYAGFMLALALQPVLEKSLINEEFNLIVKKQENQVNPNSPFILG